MGIYMAPYADINQIYHFYLAFMFVPFNFLATTGTQNFGPGWYTPKIVTLNPSFPSLKYSLAQLITPYIPEILSVGEKDEK